MAFNVFSLIVIIMFLGLGTYVVTRNMRNRLSWIFFVCLAAIALDIALTMMMDQAKTLTLMKLYRRVDWFVILVGQLAFFLVAYFINNKANKITKGTMQFFKFVILPSFSLVLILVLLENGFFYFDRSEYIANEFVRWSLHSTPWRWFYVCFASLNSICAMVLFRNAYNSQPQGKQKDALKFLYFAGVLTGFSIIYYILSNTIVYMIQLGAFEWYNYIFLPEIGFIIMALTMGIGIIRYQLFMEEGRGKLAKDLMLYFVDLVVIALIYVLFYLILSKLEPGLTFSWNYVYLLTITVILTHSFITPFRDVILESYKRQSLALPSLLTRQVALALRGYGTPAELETSALMGSVLVKHALASGKLSRAEALQQVLREAIESCKPRDPIAGRSVNQLKYEILRMTAYEGDTEEQIMWDLGFEPGSDLYTKRLGGEARKPRYPYTGKGDYPATSRASFKRLKAQAIEDVRWYLEEREKQAGE